MDGRTDTSSRPPSRAPPVPRFPTCRSRARRRPAARTVNSSPPRRAPTCSSWGLGVAGGLPFGARAVMHAHCPVVFLPRVRAPMPKGRSSSESTAALLADRARSGLLDRPPARHLGADRHDLECRGRRRDGRDHARHRRLALRREPLPLSRREATLARPRDWSDIPHGRGRPRLTGQGAHRGERTLQPARRRQPGPRWLPRDAARLGDAQVLETATCPVMVVRHRSSPFSPSAPRHVHWAHRRPGKHERHPCRHRPLGHLADRPVRRRHGRARPMAIGLFAPTEVVADCVSTTYTFDEIRGIRHGGRVTPLGGRLVVVLARRVHSWRAYAAGSAPARHSPSTLHPAGPCPAHRPGRPDPDAWCGPEEPPVATVASTTPPPTSTRSPA